MPLIDRKNAAVCECEETALIPVGGWRGFCAALNAALAKTMPKGLTE